MITIRNLQPSDEPRWRELWDGYTRFYEREPVEKITAHLWPGAPRSAFFWPNVGFHHRPR